MLIIKKKYKNIKHKRLLVNIVIHKLDVVIWLDIRKVNDVLKQEVNCLMKL